MCIYIVIIYLLFILFIYIICLSIHIERDIDGMVCRQAIKENHLKLFFLIRFNHKAFVKHIFSKTIFEIIFQTYSVSPHLES